jgi:hypothetical protein
MRSLPSKTRTQHSARADALDPVAGSTIAPSPTHPLSVGEGWGEGEQLATGGLLHLHLLTLTLPSPVLKKRAGEGRVTGLSTQH